MNLALHVSGDFRFRLVQGVAERNNRFDIVLIGYTQYLVELYGGRLVVLVECAVDVGQQAPRPRSAACNRI